MIELGVVGAGVFVLVALSGFIGILRKALVNSNPSLNCLVVIVLSLLTRSSIESVLAGPFSMFTALFMAGCCVGITALVESQARPAAATLATAPAPRGRAGFPGRPI